MSVELSISLRKGLKFICLAFFILFMTYCLSSFTIETTIYSFKSSFLSKPIELEHSVTHFSWSNENGAVHQLPIGKFLSKSFSLSSFSEESQIVPYHYKAEVNMTAEDITIVTLITRNRIPNLSRLATKYQGPISATLHISNDEEGDYTLEILSDAMEGNPDMRKFVDIHIVRDEFDRELNLWRNIAKLFARTDYVMQLDIDFYTCTDIRESILNNPIAMALLKSGRTALVIPAFEFSKQEDGLDYRQFPETKAELIEAYKNKKVEMFHSFWLPGHAPTDYDRWIEGEKDIYEVTGYQFSYEPYVIFKNQGSPWCDERFSGYGSNKAACLFELYISGVDYYVLPDDYIVHQTHAYPDEARQVERYYNRRLYAQYREEVCIRLARRFISQKKWEDPVSENLRQECSSIKPFQRAIERFV